jgi:thiol-disulfide isomerase/thioredoxin
MILQDYLPFLGSNLEAHYVKNITITHWEANSTSGKELIKQNHIKKLPAVLVSLSHTSLSNWISEFFNSSSGVRISELEFLVQLGQAPYYDVVLAKPVGLVSGISINASNCSRCMDSADYLTFLEKDPAFVVFSSKRLLSEEEAAPLIKKYNITKLPTVLFSNDITAYSFFNESLLPFGSVDSDGWFVLRNTTIPYVDLSNQSYSQRVRGIVDVRVIEAKNCSNCFNATAAATNIANNEAITLGNFTYFDSTSAEGKALVVKYNITTIPTFIYSSELAIYPTFTELWSEDNVVAPDGSFVFTSAKMFNLTSVYVS